MTKENVIEVRFNLYDGSRSDIPSFLTEGIEVKSFGYGDCFGHDGKVFWMDINQNLDELDEVDDEHQEMYTLLRDIYDDNF